jgi:hypothetical protein
MYNKILKVFRKIYSKIKPSQIGEGRNWKMFSNKEYANELIYKKLIAEEPCMIARFGSTEMLNLVNYIGVKRHNTSAVSYIKGTSLPWWWEQSSIDQLQNWSGFFPKDIAKVEQFCDLMLKDIEQIDVLGSWLYEENYFEEGLTKAKRVVLEDLEPFFSTNPWTRALKGKKVLVVHPFAESIEQQYLKRELLFEDKNMLPDFELKTIKAIQSLGEADKRFKDWFEALNYMKAQIDAIDYDIAIIGCGAYGLPLAAHVKRQNKKSIHMAGATQLLFGIKGKRWEEFVVWPYMNLFNEYWVRPGEKDKPKNAEAVEGACYW